MSLKLPLPDTQLVTTCDASKHAASNVLLIREYTEEQAVEINTSSPAAFGSKQFTPEQKSLTMFAMNLAFDELSHNPWGTRKLLLVMTHSKGLTKFFLAKHILFLMELFWANTPVDICSSSCTWCTKSTSRLFLRLELRPFLRLELEDKLYLKLT